jgi:hydrogenase/urease accessory protein HupE
MGMTLSGRALAAALALFVAALVWTGSASAHQIGLSTAEYTARRAESGAELVAKMAFARGEVIDLVPGLDGDKDGHVSAAEVAKGEAALEARILRRVHVTSAGADCKALLVDAALTEQDGLLVHGKWLCAEAGSTLEVSVDVLDDLAHGHRHVARAIGAASADEVLYRAHKTLSIALPSASGAAEAPRATGTTAASVFGFFKMGVEHILTGYDHLVFLLGLVLVRGRVRSLLAVVTAFTVAHSISLAVAVLGVWTPSSRIVEPAIALSIAYVGVENFFVKNADKRWRITFPFGLIHGFGFAGALQELSLPRAAVPGALVSFNLGVEAGQLAVMALVLPLVIFLRDKTWFEARGVRLVSGAVAVAGGLWFVARVVSG